MFTRLVLLALTHVVVLLCCARAEACKCGAEPTPREALAAADAAFVGTIVDQRSYINVDSSYTGPAIEYDVIVQRAWKGIVQPRLSLRRLSRCSPAFSVGQTSLIFAGGEHGHLAVWPCLPVKPVAKASEDLAQLGAASVTFAGPARPVATSLPLSRRLRAYVVTGIGVYAYTYTERQWISPTWDMILLSTASVVLVVAAAVSLLRRRWRAGAWFLAASILMLAVNVLWTGHVFMRSDWSEPYFTVVTGADV
jgi:hypothetical protein